MSASSTLNMISYMSLKRALVNLGVEAATRCANKDELLDLAKETPALNMQALLEDIKKIELEKDQDRRQQEELQGQQEEQRRQHEEAEHAADVELAHQLSATYSRDRLAAHVSAGTTLEAMLPIGWEGSSYAELRHDYYLVVDGYYRESKRETREVALSYVIGVLHEVFVHWLQLEADTSDRIAACAAREILVEEGATIQAGRRIAHNSTSGGPVPTKAQVRMIAKALLFETCGSKPQVSTAQSAH